MGGLLAAEFLRQRRSGILAFALLGGLIPAIANLLMPSRFEWPGFAAASALYLNLSSLLIVPSIAGYALSREWENRTIDAMLAGPVPRQGFILAKLALVIPQLACMYLSSFLVTLIGGSLRGGSLPPIEVLFWRRYISCLSGLAGLHFLLAPAALFLAVLAKKAIAPIALGLSYVVMYKLLTYWEWGSVIPPCVPVFFFFSSWGISPPDIQARFNPFVSLAASLGWGASFFVASLFAFSRLENSKK